jgi:hypothetical protein
MISQFLYSVYSSTMVRIFAQSADNIAPCTPANDQGFFGLPTWYKYLDGVNVDTYNPVDNTITKLCSPHLNGIEDIWLVALAVIDIVLRIVGLLAVAWVIWGGLQYLTSQGEPDRTKNAKDTILNALIGLVICMLSVTLINFLGNQFK